ncbi:hypothetical protein NKG05_11320 [Oerskovia sp. M15]
MTGSSPCCRSPRRSRSPVRPGWAHLLCLRRVVNEADLERTYQPRTALRWARTLWELCRIVPVFVTCAIGLGVLFALAVMVEAWGLVSAAALSGVVLLVAGAVAAGLTTIAKWAFVGVIRPGEHPLWSSFIWRTEVSDTFTEMVAAPWFANAASGTPALALWLRSLGAKIGRVSGPTATGCPSLIW